MLGIVYQGVAFPLLFSMLKKRGNSNSQERINLIERYINLFGKDSIECIVADREFVGERWLKYLNDYANVCDTKKNICFSARKKLQEQSGRLII